MLLSGVVSFRQLVLFLFCSRVVPSPTSDAFVSKYSGCNGIYVNRIYIHLINIIFILVLFFLWVNVKCFAFAVSANLFEVVNFSTCCTYLSICWASSGQMNGTTVLASLSQRHSGLFSQMHIIWPLHSVSCRYFVSVFCFI